MAMNAPVAHELQGLGLQKKEAAVYLAALSLGTASIAELSKRALLKRPTTYLIVDELVNKGLLIAVPRGKKVCYKPENPEKLKEKAELLRQTLEARLPALITLFQKTNVQPKMSFYENKEGMWKLYERIFRSKEIWAMFSPDRFYELFTREDIRHLFRLLDRQNGKIYDILEDTKRGRQDAGEPHRFALSAIRFLPRGVKISTDTLVFGNAVVFISFDSLIGVLIEDRGIAATVTLLLKTLWEQCELYKEV